MGDKALYNSTLKDYTTVGGILAPRLVKKARLQNYYSTLITDKVLILPYCVYQV